MIKNYFTVVVRHFRRHPVFSSINVSGLAVGMAVCLLLFIFVNHEHRFDAFHKKQDRIYRLNEIQSFEGMSAQHVALSMYPMGPAMVSEFPEVESYVRFVDASEVLVYEDRQILIEAPSWVDSTFFDVFDFELMRGDEATALSGPGAALLTASTARRLFGDKDPMGETVLSGQTPLRVTGILRDVPATSHLQFDALFSLRTIEQSAWLDNWGSNWLVTYLLLSEGSDHERLDAKFSEFVTSRIPEDWASFYTLYLQPLLDVHLGSSNVTHDYRNFRKFDRKYVYLFTLLAIFVLVIAAINFTNISTARAALRAKEVGVRKAIGAMRLELAHQFLGESVLLAVAALVAALLLTVAALPLVSVLTDRDLSLDFFLDPAILLLIAGTTLVVGLLAGLYPALVLSSFKPVHVLKQQIAFSPDGGRRLTLRNGLVVLQFTIAIAMIAGTILTFEQLQFMQLRDTGFDRRQAVIVPLNRTANEKYDVLKAELLQHPHIRAVTASGQRLGNNIHQAGMRLEGTNGVREISSSHLIVDHDYLSFYGIEILAGRAFSRERETDVGRAYVVNEAMVKEVGWDEPVGKRLGYSWLDTMGTIIGVVEDFNFNSLHHKVQPIALSIQDWGYSEMSVRIDESEMEETLAFMKTKWDRLVGDRPFQYEFLDDHFSQLYESDRKVSQVVGLLAILAILIACLGLFGLSAITIDQRTKEIGIRKILGATVLQLVVLLSRGFGLLVLVSLVIGSVPCYLLMRRWLDGFAYHIDIDVGVFVTAGLVGLGIALLTVGVRAMRAAGANPVKSLRYE